MNEKEINSRLYVYTPIRVSTRAVFNCPYEASIQVRIRNIFIFENRLLVSQRASHASSAR